MTMAAMEKTSSAISSENSADMEQRKILVKEKLQMREEERQDEVKKRRDELESATVANETTEFFTQNFSKTKNEVEEKLENTGTIEKSELTSHFDVLLVLVQKLQKYLTDSTMFIPTFEMQKAQQTISKFLV